MGRQVLNAELDTAAVLVESNWRMDHQHYCCYYMEGYFLVRRAYRHRPYSLNLDCCRSHSDNMAAAAEDAEVEAEIENEEEDDCCSYS